MEEDGEKTAFTTGRGLYQCRAMGLTNSLATFQRIMELVLRGFPCHIWMVYLDDAFYSCTLEDHSSLGGGLNNTGCGLEAQPQEISLIARDLVVFFGHVVSRQGLQPDPCNSDKAGQSLTLLLR